jgi:hypothetical protein
MVRYGVLLSVLATLPGGCISVHETKRLAEALVVDYWVN